MADLIISICSSHQTPISNESNPPVKKKRNLPGTPDPEAEVIALSPKTLMATNRFLCEICAKGFQRDQNLQLHRRGHNLPWKLKQRTSKEIQKRVYVCPEKTCVHHHPSRALGDLTGIKKHYCRKHGEKKWKCEKCSKKYAVHSDWKAHSKTCGTREYKCDCGTIFSRRDSFITHRAFCEALAEETARFTANNNNYPPSIFNHQYLIGSSLGKPVTRPNFAPIFSPNPANDDQYTDPLNPAGQGLPVWLAENQAHHLSQEPISKNVQEMHPMGLIPINNYTITALSNNNDSPMINTIDWDFENKLSHVGPNEALITNHNNNPLNIPLLTNEKEVSVPSLYSSQSQEHHLSTSTMNISAMALLQKAAQIGDISSSARDGNTFCGVYGSNLAMDVSANDLSALGRVEIYRPPKRRRLGNDDAEMMTGSETRDFLGVGIRSICHPPSINGWM